MIPTSGTAVLLGEKIQNGKCDVFSRIGSVIETPTFYANFNASENLELHCGYMDGGYEHIDDTLSMLGFSDTANKPVKSFALGMK